MTARVLWVEEGGRITISREFTSRSAAQAGLSALALVVESGFVPCEPVAVSATTVAEPATVPDESDLPPHALADADEAAPEMMDEDEARSR